MMRWIIGVPFGLVASVLLWADWPTAQLPDGAQADLVVVSKSRRTLELYRGHELLRSYRVSLGPNPVGAKREEGDGRTPEGLYHLDYRNPDSAFHRSLHVSYPSSADVAAARARRVDPGGLVMLHGMKNRFGWIGRLHRFDDWTNGCIAVTDDEMDELWRVVPVGTPIRIEP